MKAVVQGPSGFPSHDMLGLRMDYVDWTVAREFIIRRAEDGGAGYCCVPDANQCVLCHDDAAFRAIVNGAVLTISDSTVLQKVRGLVHGVRPAATIKGADMMAELCRRAAEQGIAVALIGGKSDAVLDALKKALLERYPALKIAFAYSPPFAPISASEDDALVAGIRASGARLVFVGLGCPKQERWMAAHADRIDATMIGVGAAFDFISGAVRPSPPWVHRNGLEWLYRLVSEPRRLWRRYLLTAPRFLFLVARARLKGG